MVRPALRIVWLAAGLALGAGAAGAEAPRRVVSINLCTDQLALLLAAPGQVVSVSYLARDPALSPMVAAAANIPTNRASAEEVWLMRPDLVLAGAATPPDTLRMLDRLGVPVETFPAETALDDIRAHLLRMGQLLGREAEARAQVARFDAGLAALSPPPGPRPVAVIYGANGYVAGPESLSGAILTAAGYRNMAADYGMGGTMPLEDLLLARPDLVVLGARNPGHSRAEAVLDHPALRTIVARQSHAVVEDRNWTCGTPHVLAAIRSLRDARPPGTPAP